MTAALIIFALMVLACMALGVYATVKAVGAAKRGVDRTIEQARRTVEDTTLRARSVGQGGVLGALAQLRMELRTSMRATKAALDEGVRQDASLHESLALFRQLSAHGLELDAELKRLEQEPDRTKTSERLPELRERAKRITASADSLRWAAHDRARRFADDDLTRLTSQIEVESDALRDWSRTDTDEAWGLTDAPGDSAPSAAGAPTATSAPSTPQDPKPLSAPQTPPSGQYPWQKSPRPEAAG